jgi:UDP-N-acetylglucosamine 2-epimerase (non-hydrolysing)
VVDALKHIRASAARSPRIDELLRLHRDRRVIALTTHRRENFGEVMTSHLQALRCFVERHPEILLVFPVHPNPAVRAATAAVLGGSERICCIEPLE